LADSALPQREALTPPTAPRTPNAGPTGPVIADEFNMVGVYDIDWLLEPRFDRMLEYMAASPVAFKVVRVFGALSSGTLENLSPPRSTGIVWPSTTAPIDFSRTFAALEALTRRGLTPFVVLSFFPTAVSSNPTVPPTSFENWKTLVRAFFDQLVDDPRFGPSLVSQWWFEVWNEPNLEDQFWRGTFAQYLELYRATSEAVVASGHAIRLGGPAIAYLPTDRASRMEEFLRFVSANPDVKCDFVSFHRKGASVPGEDPDITRPFAAADETARLALTIDAARFSGITIINNEADMTVGFQIPFEPRMDERFPAWLASVMIGYDALSSRFRASRIRFMAAADDANVQLVKACFDGRRSIVTAASASVERDVFKAPVFNFYEMLRLLGDRHGTFVTGGDVYFPSSSLFHAVTCASTHIASIFSTYPLDDKHVPESWSLDYSVHDLPWTRVNVVRFQIDHRRSNAFDEAGRWVAGSQSVPFPSASRARRIRAAQELTVVRSIDRDIALPGGSYQETFEMDPYTVTAFWITPFIRDAPAAPGSVKARFGDEGENVVVTWSPDRSPWFYSYEVYLVIDGTPRALLSPVPLRSATWVDTAPPLGTRAYAVRTVSASGVASHFVTSNAVTVV
jgi:hypothetical protein